MTPPAATSHPNDTRDRLLQAALAAFGHRDFDAVSVREIVERAGANLAAVSYHFGGKQGLYLATAAFLADAMQQRLAPTLDEIAGLATQADPTEAAKLLGRLIHRLAGSLLIDPLGDDAAGFILREQHQPTDAFDILYERLMLPIQQTFASLVARTLGDGAPDARSLTLITHALTGQIIGFRMARETALRRLGQRAFDTADVEQIADTITQLTITALRGDSAWKPTS